jgi:DNA polymerase-4
VWTEPILHVDMDSFFVEVERRDDPTLVGIPVAVGGTGPRGVIASASYEAREFGVHSAQPTSTARRLCPQLVVVPSAHRRYGEASVEVFEVFRDFTPAVEALSLDEAFLDVSGLRLHHPTPLAVGEAIRRRLRAQLGLPASVGVASVKFIAKLASERAKPDGLLHVPFDSQLEFLHALPVGALWGVGPATHAALANLGVQTIGDIASLPEPSLHSALGPTTGAQLHLLAMGIDTRAVVPDSSAKSVSVEETFDSDLESHDVIEAALLALAQELSGRLRRAGLVARTVNLKLRYADFATISRAITHPTGAAGARSLYRLALDLLDGVELSRPVRLLGLGGSNLEEADAPHQLDLGSEQDWERVEDAIAGVRDRFGPESVRPARLVGPPLPPDE